MIHLNVVSLSPAAKGTQPCENQPLAKPLLRENSGHPKNSLNSLKPEPAKGDSDKLPEMNGNGNTAFLKQIPSKNYIKIYLYSSGVANICVDSC